MGIDSEDDDWVCKTNGAKSFGYCNNNINLKVKYLRNKIIFKK